MLRGRTLNLGIAVGRCSKKGAGSGDGVTAVAVRLYVTFPLVHPEKFTNSLFCIVPVLLRFTKNPFDQELPVTDEPTLA